MTFPRGTALVCTLLCALQMLIHCAKLSAQSSGQSGAPSAAQVTDVPVIKPSAEAIMAQVAANQDKDQSERTHYVYLQHAKVTSRKGKTLMCEEVTDIRVTPYATGSHQQLIKLDGRVLAPHGKDTHSKDPEGKDPEGKSKNGYIAYNTLLPDKDNPEPIVEGGHDSITIDIGDNDRSLVEGIRNGLTNDHGGGHNGGRDSGKDGQSGEQSGNQAGEQSGNQPKDGIGAHLFPLTTSSQAGYAFHLIGREQINGRDVFHIDFRPKDKNDYSWKGDAYIDATAYQPVVVSTTMNRKLPFAVRTLLGTSLPGLGFTVVYAPQPDQVWFPTSFSTEFKIKILFFFNREITIDAKNLDFKKTHSEGVIVDTEPASSKQPD